MNQEEIHYFEKGVSQLKLWMMFFLVVVIAVTAALFTQQYFFIQRIQEEGVKNHEMINSLIDEIGSVQEDNLLLQTRLKYVETYLEKLPAKLQELQQTDESTIDFDTFESDLFNKVESGAQVIYPNKVTNVLIMGTNQGLTDTIMIASVNPENATVSLVSVPRDLSVKGRKINELYTYYGPEKLMDELYDITGLKIDHYAVVNMQGFVDVVDILGGIDVTNEKAIVDYSYPTPNKGYMTYSLSAGEHHLNGNEALKYARSRKSTSDFDRAKRQQQIVESAVKKFKELGITDIHDIADIYAAASENIDTDISLWQGIDYYSTYRSFSFETGNVLDTTEFLYSTQNVKGQFVLLPIDNNYVNIQKEIYNIVIY